MLKDLKIYRSQVFINTEMLCVNTIEEEIDMNINTVKSGTRLLEDMDFLDLPKKLKIEGEKFASISDIYN